MDLYVVIIYIYLIPYIVHEHNHTRILVPEVLCSLGGQETQNDPTAVVMTSMITVALIDTFTCKIL